MNIPEEAIRAALAVVDRHAGREHSNTGSVATALREALEAAAPLIAAQVLRGQSCGSCGATPYLVAAHRRGCKSCPRCGGTDSPIGEWDVCGPCAAAERSLDCRVYWGHDGCDLARGHEGKHRSANGEVDTTTAFLFGEDLTPAEIASRDAHW